MNDFKCRTMEVRRIRYRIEMVDILYRKVITSTSCENKEEADDYIERHKKFFSKGDFSKYDWNIIPIPIVEKICIECGAESWQ